MSLSICNEETCTGNECDSRQIACMPGRIHRRLIWIICAASSLLSSRHLLVDKNLHFPLQLYFNQLVVTVLMIPLLRIRRQNTVPHRPSSDTQNPSAWRLMLLIVSMCAKSLSIICALQAILHFRNLPTLTMMTIIAQFAEGVLLFIIRAPARRRTELLLISLLVPATVGLLFTEYRITVPGVAASVSAMLLAGVDRALSKALVRYDPHLIVDERRYMGKFVLVEALIGTIWLRVFWSGNPVFEFHSGHILLLAINATTSALAIALGGSLLFPTDDGVVMMQSPLVQAPLNRLKDVWTSLILTGMIGCASTLTTRRSYTNTYQYGFYMLSMLCISCRTMLDGSHTQHWVADDAYDTYYLTDVSIERGTNRSDDTVLAEDESPVYAPASSSTTRVSKIGCRAFVSAGIVLLWSVYGFLNSIERSEHYPKALLDRKYVAEIPLEVVLSMYAEPVGDVRKVIHSLKSLPALSDGYFTIYTKDSKADTKQIKELTGANRVIKLPNIGREGETYLNHILHNWNSLARQSIFLQANVHNPREFYSHINNYYSRSMTGFLNLGWSGAVCDCQNCGDEQFWQDRTRYLPYMHNRMYNSTDCGNVLLSYKGQFVVSAARIRGIDKEIYHDIRQAFVDKNSWAHQRKYLQGRPDSMSAPDFGYTVERMWNLLFQCSNIEVAWKCPSLISAWRIGGNISDCQCFDS